MEEVADAESEVSEWELRERMEREEERGAETEALGAEVEVGDGEEPPLFHPTPVHGVGWRGVGDGHTFPSVFPLLFPWRVLSSPGQAWAEGKGALATSRLARTADCDIYSPP